MKLLNERQINFFGRLATIIYSNTTTITIGYDSPPVYNISIKPNKVYRFKSINGAITINTLYLDNAQTDFYNKIAPCFSIGLSNATNLNQLDDKYCFIPSLQLTRNITDFDFVIPTGDINYNRFQDSTYNKYIVVDTTVLTPSTFIFPPIYPMLADVPLQIIPTEIINEKYSFGSIFNRYINSIQQTNNEITIVPLQYKFLQIAITMQFNIPIFNYVLILNPLKVNYSFSGILQEFEP